MKKTFYLQIASSVPLMLSKYFLAISSPFGWWLSIAGYVMAIIFNLKVGLKITTIVVSGLVLLSVYGLYKWTYEISGLQIIDFLIIGLSSAIAVIFVISEFRAKRPFWLLQTISMVARIIAFLTIGMGIELGWVALLINHISNAYTYHKKKAYVIFVMQLVSIVISLMKVWELFFS